MSLYCLSQALATDGGSGGVAVGGRLVPLGTVDALDVKNDAVEFSGFDLEPYALLMERYLIFGAQAVWDASGLLLDGFLYFRDGRIRVGDGFHPSRTAE